MAGLRNTHGICPPEVVRFLLDLFKYNDNSKNHYSDNYYRAALVDALAATITPVISVLQPGAPITADSLSADTKLVLEEITRVLNLEKVLPCYKNTVTVSCLRSIRRLQQCGHLPSTPTLFRAYAQYGQYIDVRLAAFECLVDFVRVDGKPEDLSSLVTTVESDPDPAVRHTLARLLVKMPPFQRAQRHRLDTESVVHRLWNNINSHLSNDARLRCDLVDLYYTLYGNKRPLCLPVPEIQAMMKQMHHKDRERIERDKAREREREIQRELEIKPVIKQELVEVKVEPNPVLVEVGTKRRASSPPPGQRPSPSPSPSAAPSPSPSAAAPPAPLPAAPPPPALPPVTIKVEDDLVDVTTAPNQVPVRVFTDEAKREYLSENSVSLPGLQGPPGPVGFEPGMFHGKTDMGPSKPKKKKKDKKKHKHKHKHKHSSKDKSTKDKERHVSKEKEFPKDGRVKQLTAAEQLKIKEDTRETLSSFSSSQSPSSDHITGSSTSINF